MKRRLTPDEQADLADAKIDRQIEREQFGKAGLPHPSTCDCGAPATCSCLDGTHSCCLCVECEGEKYGDYWGSN